MESFGRNWQEQLCPEDVSTPYSTVSWSSTGWVRDAETQTSSVHDLIKEELAAMIRDSMRAKGLPLVACPHTRALQLQFIINGIVESHMATCTPSSKDKPKTWMDERTPSSRDKSQNWTDDASGERDDDEDGEAAWMLETLSSALNVSTPQQSKSKETTVTAPRQQRKSPMGGGALTKSMPQQSGSKETTVPASGLERKRPFGGQMYGSNPERNKFKKAKRAPHGTVYPCAKCNTTFGMQKDLIKHYNTVHSLTRPFKCKQCELWFKKNSDRTKHTNAVHLNVFNFYCSVCNRGCNSKNKLIDHENTHLKDEDRPNRCRYCNKGFAARTDLKLHLRSHEEDTKVQCELCTGRFLAYNQNYKSHMKLVHKAFVRGNSNKCLLCDKEFGEYKQRPLLMEHMKETHSDVGVVCETCGRKFDTEARLETHGVKEHPLVFQCKPHSLKTATNNSQPVGRSTYKKIKLVDRSTPSNAQKVHVYINDTARELLRCNLCVGLFTKKATLDRHWQTHIRNDDTVTDDEAKSNESTTDEGSANDAPEIATSTENATKTRLATEKQSTHLDTSSSTSTDPSEEDQSTTCNEKKVNIYLDDARIELLMCRSCGDMFSKKSALDRHGQTHINRKDAGGSAKGATTSAAFIVERDATPGTTVGCIKIEKPETDTESLIEDTGSSTPIRKSSRLKRKKLKAVDGSAACTDTKPNVKDQSRISEHESQEGAVQSTRAKPDLNVVSGGNIQPERAIFKKSKRQAVKGVKGQTRKTAAKNLNQDNSPVESGHSLSSTLAKSMLCVQSSGKSGDKESKYALDPAKLAKLMQTGKVKVTITVPVTSLKKPSSVQTASKSMQQSTDKTQMPTDGGSSSSLPGAQAETVVGSQSQSDCTPSKPTSAQPRLPGPRADTGVAAGGSKSDCKPSTSSSTQQYVDKTGNASKDKTAAAPASESNTKTASSSSSSMHDANVEKPLGVQPKDGTITTEKMAELIQAGKIQLSMFNAPGIDSPASVKQEMILVDKAVVLVDNLSDPSTSLLRIRHENITASSTTTSPSMSISNTKVKPHTSGQQNQNIGESCGTSPRSSPHRPIILSRRTPPVKSKSGASME